MKKYFKISLFISSILLIILLPLLFLIKYDIYQNCLIIKKQNKKYILLEQKVYNELTNQKQIIIKSNTKIYKLNINYWNYDRHYKCWYSQIKLKDDFNNTEILTKKVNLLGF